MTPAWAIAVAVLVRLGLVVLFLPFSALDKILNFQGAVGQAKERFSSDLIATSMILTGLFIEVFMSLGIVIGIADRLCALVLAVYCAATAVLFKQFWTPGDFWQRGPSRGRDLFWDFLKNFSLAGGFLLVTFGTNAASVPAFIHAPLASSRPYYAGAAAPQ